jgi:hypothetical protein
MNTTSCRFGSITDDTAFENGSPVQALRYKPCEVYRSEWIRSPLCGFQHAEAKKSRCNYTFTIIESAEYDMKDIFQ